MPKRTNNPIKEEDLTRALYRLNLFFADVSMWFPISAKKDHVDLFDVPIPVGATYYKRSVRLNSQPLVILSKQSLTRLYQCLFTANSKLDSLVAELERQEGLLIGKAFGLRPEEGG